MHLLSIYFMRVNLTGIKLREGSEELCELSTGMFSR